MLDSPQNSTSPIHSGIISSCNTEWLGTTALAQEVKQRMEQLPRVGAVLTLRTDWIVTPARGWLRGFGDWDSGPHRDPRANRRLRHPQDHGGVSALATANTRKARAPALPPVAHHPVVPPAYRQEKSAPARRPGHWRPAGAEYCQRRDAYAWLQTASPACASVAYIENYSHAATRVERHRDQKYTAVYR